MKYNIKFSNGEILKIKCDNVNHLYDLLDEYMQHYFDEIIDFEMEVISETPGSINDFPYIYCGCVSERDKIDEYKNHDYILKSVIGNKKKVDRIKGIFISGKEIILDLGKEQRFAIPCLNMTHCLDLIKELREKNEINLWEGEVKDDNV